MRCGMLASGRSRPAMGGASQPIASGGVFAVRHARPRGGADARASHHRNYVDTFRVSRPGQRGTAPRLGTKAARDRAGHPNLEGTATRTNNKDFRSRSLDILTAPALPHVGNENATRG